MDMRITIGLLFAASIILFIYGTKNVGDTVPDEEREYMDPLPFKMKVIWPLVNFFAYYLGPLMNQSYVEKINMNLKRSELSYLMKPAQLFGLQISSAVVVGLIFFLVIYFFELGGYIYIPFAMLLGFYMPLMSASERRKQREKKLVRDLPIYLDYFVMSLEAGMNLSGAIQQSVQKGPKGPLNAELATVLRDIRAGMNRSDALKQLSDRVGLREVRYLVSSLSQAEKSGGSIIKTLKVQADQRRTERFQKAEKLALEAPVKLIFPLVAFIFPCTFVVIFFPIVIKFMTEV